MWNEIEKIGTHTHTYVYGTPHTNEIFGVQKATKNLWLSIMVVAF